MTADRSATEVIISLEFTYSVVWLQRLVFKTSAAGRILLAKSATSEEGGLKAHLDLVLITLAVTL